MAEIFLTFAAEEILKKVASLAAQEFNLAWGFKAELTRLSESLNTIHDILSDAVEQPQGRGKAVEEWVKKLKHIAYDADDVLDEFKYEDLRSKVGLRNQIHIKVLITLLSQCFSS
ncbi:NB-ARC domain-containing disease resistance protein [Prunus dulcis]|uniref:NB-ARC domain-containing disease resistance protein n=1 Tax=Prunus dulcis TaxID=3755 RepID=A0A4Y1QLI9_PRUDU|nr:NB-ARC domain-containing disease resistance protein [Prunus dulcis]